MSELKPDVMTLAQRFFIPVKELEACNETDCNKINSFIKPLVILARVTSLSIYIIDYSKKSFAYVSPNPLFLCGHEVELVKEMGFDFFDKIVPLQDLNMLLEINEKGFDFFYKLPSDAKDKCFISYDFRIVHQNGNEILVNHKFFPLCITSDGNIWLAMCIVTLSENTTPGNVFIQMLNEPVKYEYSFKLKKFIRFNAASLSEREVQVLKYMAQGYSANDIATLVHLNVNTVKYHKAGIFKKLHVKSSPGAVNYAIANGIL